MGKQKKQTIGFRYFFGIHMGLSRGPIDEIVEIRVGDRTAWKYDPDAPPLPSAASFAALEEWKASAGDYDFWPVPPADAYPAWEWEKNDYIGWNQQITGNQTIRIKAGNIFGGEESEGGVEGYCDIMMGASDQPVNSKLATMLGGLVPAFRGSATMFFDGMVCALSKYPKPWAVRERRTTSGWDGEPWYPAKAIIWLDDGKIKAYNGAHIIYECLTNTDWGSGKARAELNEASFIAAADTLYAENFGLCLRWTRKEKIAAFIEIVQSHIGSNLYQDRVTGLWTLDLVRDSDDLDALPLFTADTGLLGIEEDENAATVIAANVITVTYFNPEEKSEGKVQVKNSAGIRAAGGTIGETVNYPGIPTADLALRVAQRDLRTKYGIKRFKVKLDRRAYQIKPGGLFRIAAPERGIGNLVLRAGRIDDGTLGAGAITITAVMDVFGLPANSYVAVQPSTAAPIITAPQPITTREIMEVPYRDLAATLTADEIANLTPGTGLLSAISASPSGLSRSYFFDTRVGNNAWSSTSGDFAATATIQDAIEIGIDKITVTFATNSDLSFVEFGTAALMNNEIFRVDIIDVVANTAVLARGCVDTLPQAHAAGSRIFFYEDHLTVDETEYGTGVAVSTRLRSQSGEGVLSESLATVESFTIALRGSRPYPPAKLLINGSSYPSVIHGDLSLAWSHRDRILQADQLIDQTMDSIGLEYGTTYSLTIRGESLLIDSVTTTANTFSLNRDHELALGLVDAGTNRVFRSQGLESITTTVSANVATLAQPARVNGGWMEFTGNASAYNDVNMTGSYVDATTGAKTQRTYDNTLIPTQAFSLKSGVPVLFNTQNFTGWAIYGSEPGHVYTGAFYDTANAHQPFKDRRINPSHIVTATVINGDLSFSAQQYPADARAMFYSGCALYVIQKSAVVTGPMSVTRTLVTDFYYARSDWFTSITGGITPVSMSTGITPIIIFGSLLYVKYYAALATDTTSGKLLDITNVVTAHITFATTSQLMTRRYTITSGGVLALLDSRAGAFLADQLSATQGFEIEISTKIVRFVDSSTGAIGSTLGTLSYVPIAVYGDTTNELIYILGIDGVLRKYSNALVLLSSITLGVGGGFGDIKEAAVNLYVECGGINYEVKKDFSGARKLLGFGIPSPWYSDPTSTVILAKNGSYGLADESGIASSVFNASTPRLPSYLSIELVANRDGYESFTKHNVTVTRHGMGLNMGQSMGG